MNKISFVFRNEIQTVDFQDSKFTPNTTLLQYIRSFDFAKGTKEGCNEGDCGACTVVLVEKINGKLVYRAVNSCVVFLPAVHGKQIITVEDLGNSDNLHPIQQIFVDEHASQCGFCTPGFIMSLFAQKAAKINSSKDELVEAMHGNLCRCTGYRPIVAAAEDIAKLQDLKDFQTFAREDLIDQINRNQTIELKKDNYSYFIPFSLDDALKLTKQNPDATITAGNTDLVLKVTKRKEPVFKIIDISFIEEIQGITETENSYVFGAGTKVEDVYEFSKEKLPAFAEMLGRFGAKQIRNRATIGGNLATASPIGDILPLLFAYEAKVFVAGDTGKVFSVFDFVTGYRQTALQKGELIIKIEIPKPAQNQIIKSYKVSKRRHLDISTVSAGFKIELENGYVKDIVLAFGGMAEMTKRAEKTEQFLKGKQWTEENVKSAAEILKNEFSPITDARSSDVARNIMAKNLILKFYEDLSVSA